MFSKTDPTNRFRNDNNNLYSKELFIELNTKPDIALYTLKTHDYQGFPSLYLRYLSKNDPHEYDFALEYFEGWRHWEALSSTGWFSPYITSWREELAVKIQAQAIARIVRVAQSDTKDSAAANRYLAERAWETKVKGRPTKVPDAKKEASRILAEQSQLEDDFTRILGKAN